GDSQKALQIIDTVDKTSAFTPFIYYHAALMKDLLGVPHEAEKEFNKTLRDNPYLSERMLIVLSNFYHRRKLPEKEEALYQKFASAHGDVWFTAEDILAFVRESAASGAPVIRDAVDGIAEAFYGTASILHSQYSIGDAYAYIRMAL